MIRIRGVIIWNDGQAKKVMLEYDPAQKRYFLRAQSHYKVGGIEYEIMAHMDEDSFREFRQQINRAWADSHPETADQDKTAKMENIPRAAQRSKDKRGDGK